MIFSIFKKKEVKEKPIYRIARKATSNIYSEEPTYYWYLEKRDKYGNWSFLTLSSNAEALKEKLHKLLNPEPEYTMIKIIILRVKGFT